MKSTFRSLRGFNYRTWAIGALISNIGTWMQRTAQDWVVLTELTDHSATSVGVVMALQFGPQLLLAPVSGYAADRLNLRKLLFATQAAMGLLALGLGLLTLTGLLQLWQVYLFAFLLGCVTAFDSTARQTFVTELVEPTDLSNAVALNSTSFNMARMIGPAVAGVLMGAVGSGWVFLLNAGSFIAVMGSLRRLRSSELHRRIRPSTIERFSDGIRYIQGRADLKAILLMYFLIGAFALNFPIFVSTMAASVFRKGAGHFGLLTSMLAAGSVLGALLAARRAEPRRADLSLAAASLGVGFLVAALMPSYVLFALPLVLIGLSAQTFTITANSITQLTTEPGMRGRVLAILLAVAMGSTPIGAPIVGAVADRFGPRWALCIGAAAGFGALLAGEGARRRRGPGG